ncbi:MAG: isopentenyl-diphosphate Delta-isomerase [Pseudomonadota bacterium]
MSATEHVVLVDENDKETGIAEKIQAHKENLRHRAFSVFIFRRSPNPELLLQQRADSKYHSAGLWTNTCCSHPKPGESVLTGGERRLREEMGVSAALQSLGWFHYIAHFPNGLTENEIDHVLVGFIEDQVIAPDPNEVKAHRWVSIIDLKREIELDPDRFTPWLALALEIVREKLG